jgi:hypothetical protein
VSFAWAFIRVTQAHTSKITTIKGGDRVAGPRSSPRDHPPGDDRDSDREPGEDASGDDHEKRGERRAAPVPCGRAPAQTPASYQRRDVATPSEQGRYPRGVAAGSPSPTTTTATCTPATANAVIAAAAWPVDATMLRAASTSGRPPRLD